MVWHSVEFMRKIERLNKRDRLIELSKALKNAHISQDDFEKEWEKDGNT